MYVELFAFFYSHRGKPIGEIIRLLSICLVIFNSFISHNPSMLFDNLNVRLEMCGDIGWSRP